MDSTGLTTRSSGRQLKKTRKARENDEYIPIAVEPLPISIQPLLEDPLPFFEPPLCVPYEPMQSCVPVDDVLKLFLYLFSEQNLALIVESTNVYVEYFTQRLHLPNARPWYPLTRNELIVFIGSLLYMGKHYESNAEDYWSTNNPRLGTHISKTRWEQIHRFFTINPHEHLLEQLWFYKLEPLASRMRNNWQNTCTPASWLAMDEIMIAFTGQSYYTTKLLNKPIQEGFKMWAYGWKGYIGSFRFHSGGTDTDEGMTKTRKTVPFNAGDEEVAYLSPTHQVPLVLVQDIRATHLNTPYLVLLDNLFLDVDVAHCLLAINMAIVGTIRKNTTRIPQSLLDTKDSKAKLLV